MLYGMFTISRGYAITLLVAFFGLWFLTKDIWFAAFFATVATFICIVMNDVSKKK